MKNVLKTMALAACAFMFSTGISFAAYPEKPITVIIPFGAGSGADNCFRAAQPFYEKALGVKLVTDYKVGAGGMVGANYFMSTKPDGYTLLLYSYPHVVMQETFQKTAYNSNNLVPLVSTFFKDEIITVRQDSPFKTIKDLIQYAKEHPGKVTGGNTGSYSSNHMTFANLIKATGLNITRIPFENGSAMNIALLDGQIDFACSNIQWLTTHKGKIRALVSVSDLSPVQGVPTMKEMGYDATGCCTFDCLLGRSDMPKEVLDYLKSHLAKVKNMEGIQAAIEKVGSPYKFNDSEQLRLIIDNLKKMVTENKEIIKNTAD